MIPKSVPEKAKGSSFSRLQFKTSCVSKEIELNRRYFIVGERRISSYWWASIFLVGGFGFLITGISSYIEYNLLTNAYETVESFFSRILDILKPTQENSVLEIGNSLGIVHSKGGESFIFFPQGLLLCFYGSLAILLSLYWWLLIYWNVGGGFNEFNKREGFMRIFRWGYPGKNRRIDIIYPLNEIEAIRVDPGSGLLTAELFVRLLSSSSVSDQGISPSPPFPKEVLGQKTPTFPFSSSRGKGEKKEKTESISKKQGDLSLLKMARQQGSVEKIKREIPLGGIGQPLTLKELEKQASELANYLQVALEGL